MSELKEDLSAASRTTSAARPTQPRTDTRQNETKDLRWGWGSFKPSCFQCLNSSLGLLIVLSAYSIIYGMAVNGFNTAAITTLERRFHFNSKQTGLMISVTDVSSMITTIIVSFYGSFGRKPRWMALGASLVGFSLILFATPHFMVGKYDPPQAKEKSQFCQAKNSSEGACDGDSLSSSTSYLAIFLVSQIITGAGGAPLLSLSIAYLDENVNPKYTSVYIAMYYASIFLGPSIGFVVAGQLLSTYVDIIQPDDLNLAPSDPRWIGNWWLGSLVSGFVILIFVLLLLGYPQQLPRAVARRQKALENREIPAKDEEISGRIWDIIPATKSLLLNPVYMFQTFGVWAQVVLGSGVAPFFFKLMRTHYGATQALAGIAVGIIGGVSSACGTLIGSFYGRKSKLKESCKVAAKYCFYFQLVGMWMPFMFLLPGCDDLQVAQYNSTFNLTRCNCDAVKYVPVCSGNITYYSACHAGCPRQNASSQIYHNCSYVQSSQSGGDKAEAILGVCDRGCKNLFMFLTGFTLLLMLSYLNDVPGKVVTIRSVSENQRSYALGLQLVIWRGLGSLPGPVIFGSFLDRSCILWRESCGERGNCLEYRNKDVVFVIIMGSVIFQVLSVGSFLLSWYFSCKSSSPSTELLRHSDQNGEASSSPEHNGNVVKQSDRLNGFDNPVGMENIVGDETRGHASETKL